MPVGTEDYLVAVHCCVCRPGCARPKYACWRRSRMAGHASESEDESEDEGEGAGFAQQRSRGA